MTNQDTFGLVAIFYAVANLASMRRRDAVSVLVLTEGLVLLVPWEPGVLRMILDERQTNARLP